MIIRVVNTAICSAVYILFALIIAGMETDGSLYASFGLCFAAAGNAAFMLWFDNPKMNDYVVRAKRLGFQFMVLGLALAVFHMSQPIIVFGVVLTGICALASDSSGYHNGLLTYLPAIMVGSLLEQGLILPVVPLIVLFFLVLGHQFCNKQIGKLWYPLYHILIAAMAYVLVYATVYGSSTL